MDAGDWIAIVAVAFSAGSVFYAWRSVRVASRSAEASETSAGAAVRSAAAAEKSAQADYELLQMELRDRTAAEDELRRRPWSFSKVSNRKFEATFNGETAFDVRFEVNHARLDQQRRDSNDGPIEKGEVFQLTVIPFAGFDRRIMVLWREPGEDLSERSQIFSA